MAMTMILQQTFITLYFKSKHMKNKTPKLPGWGISTCVSVCPYQPRHYLIWPQRHSSSAPSTEFRLAIWTEVATAIGKLGFVADPAGWGFALLVLTLVCLLPHLLNLVLIWLKLLVQFSASKWEGQRLIKKGNMDWWPIKKLNIGISLIFFTHTAIVLLQIAMSYSCNKQTIIMDYISLNDQSWHRVYIT